MLVTTHLGHFGYLGQVTADASEERALPGLTNVVTSLSVQETQLRLTFAQLLPDLVTLQTAGQAVPPGLLALMQKFNAAVGTFMEAARVWLQARNDTAASDLPDPGAKPIAIPTFDIPTSGFGRFGAAAAVPASTIRIRHGVVGQQISTGLGEFVNFGFTGREGLGVIPLGVAICVLLGLVVIGVTIILALRILKTSDTVAVNQALATQSESRAKEVIADRDVYLSTRDACIGSSTDPAVRARCIQAAVDAVKALKEGRPEAKAFFVSTTGILSIIGGVAVVGLLAGGGYWLYRRGQSSSTLPRASRMRPRHGSSHEDESEDY